MAASFFLSASAQAAGGVALGSTRVIYPQDANQVSLPISNSDTKDVFLIQSWVSEANGAKSADFVITPPLFVIQPGRENLLRIMYTGKKVLPSDRETLYYLNSKSIPSGAPTPGKNTLQIATQNIIKLFVRPKNLPFRPDQAPGMLRCQVSGNTLSVKNASPYYVTLVQLNVGTRVLPNTMVAPLSSATVTIPGGSAGGNRVTFKTINDFGATSAGQQCGA
jgi:fimbrial chaperone protein